MEILITKNAKEVRVVHTIKTMIIICEATGSDNVDIRALVNVRIDGDYIHAGSIVVVALDYANVDCKSSDAYLIVSVSDSRAIRVFDTQFPLEIL